MLSCVDHQLTSPEFWLRAARNPPALFVAPEKAASKALHTMLTNALHKLSCRIELQVSHLCV